MPKAVHWLYTMVLRPMTTYATTVWWLRVKYKTSVAKLRNLLRLSSLVITGAMKWLL
jgi:hypothetical protein